MKWLSLQDNSEHRREQIHSYVRKLCHVGAIVTGLSSVLYIRYQVWSGAIILLLSALGLWALPIWGRKTKRLNTVIGSVTFLTISTLLLLNLSKAQFSLSSMVWFLIVPLGNLSVYGIRAMWISSGATLLLGTLCFVLHEMGMSFAFLPHNPEMQKYLDFTSWVLLMGAVAAIGLSFAHLYQSAEREREAARVMAERGNRMRAIGNLAGGVAHEFNNILMVIVGTAEHLREETDLAKMDEGLSDIAVAASRGGEISKELLVFAQGGTAEGDDQADLEEALWVCQRLLEPILGEEIELQIQVPTALPHAAISRRSLEQMIINLGINARDAMPSGGTIELGAALVSLNHSEAAQLELQAGQWLCVKIADSGFGMDEQTLARIYEPFFTTKEFGSGLGLALVFGLAQKVGGAIDVQSEVGQGTTFELYLPVVESDDREIASHSVDSEISPSKKETEIVENSATEPAIHKVRTVFIVDDQRLVRRMARRLLERAGFGVVEAENGLSALEKIKEGVEFDLLLSDVRMPGLDGAALAKEVREIYPHLPIIFMTGFAGTPEEETRLSEYSSDLLRKPFAPTDLLRLLEHRFKDESSQGAVAS